MKTSKIKISVTKFSNGDILLGQSFRDHFVQTTDGIFTYSPSEMMEIYQYQSSEY